MKKNIVPVNEKSNANKGLLYRAKMRIIHLFWLFFVRVMIPVSCIGVIIVGFETYYRFNPKSDLSYNAVPEVSAVTDVTKESKLSDEEIDALVEAKIAGKLEAKQYEVVDHVCEYESRRWKALGFDSPDSLVIFDPDSTGLAVNIPSYGHCQFKVKTVQGYVKMFYNKVLTQAEAIAWAHDHDKSRELAFKVIWLEVGGIDNWKNTVRRLNTPEEDNYDAREKITTIRSLMEL